TGARPPREADAAELCEGLSQAQQERCERCGCDPRGSGAAIDAVCSNQDERAAGWLDAAPNRQLLVRQRTMLSNALRGHLAELGIVSAKGRNGISQLLGIITDVTDNRVAPAVRGLLDVLARQYSAIGAEIRSIDKSILTWHRSCEASRRLEEIPGIGPIV